MATPTNDEYRCSRQPKRYLLSLHLRFQLPTRPSRGLEWFPHSANVKKHGLVECTGCTNKALDCIARTAVSIEAVRPEVLKWTLVIATQAEDANSPSGPETRYIKAVELLRSFCTHAPEHTRTENPSGVASSTNKSGVTELETVTSLVPWRLFRRHPQHLGWCPCACARLLGAPLMKSPFIQTDRSFRQRRFRRRHLQLMDRS